MTLDFGEDILTVNAGKHDWSIPYDQIISLELVENTNFGTLREGSEKRKLHYGFYENEQREQYTLCIDPRIENCVAIETNDGFFILNYENRDSTQELYIMFAEFLSHKTDTILDK